MHWPNSPQAHGVRRHASLGVDGGRHGGLAGGHVDGEVGLLHQRHRHGASFERAIEPVDFAKCEGWIAEQMLAAAHGGAADVFHACAIRERLADAGLSQFANVVVPEAHRAVESDMTTVEI